MTPTNCLGPDKIQEFLDKSLSSAEEMVCRQHLESCECCAEALKSAQQVFLAAQNYSQRELSGKIPSSSVDQIFAKIVKHSPGKIKQEKGNYKDESPLLQRFLKLFLLPALAVLLLVFLFNPAKVEKPDGLPAAKFDLRQNRVEVILGDEQMVSLNGQEIALKSVKVLPEDQVLKLPGSSMVMFRIGSHQIKLGSSSEFHFSKGRFFLDKGTANFDLNGPHEGLEVHAPLVTVLPVGTNFEVEVKDWFNKVSLNSGKIEVIHKNGQRRVIESRGILFFSPDGKISSRLPDSTNSVNKPVAGNSGEQTAPVEQPSTQTSPVKLIDSF